MKPPRGSLLLFALMLILVSVHYGRVLFPEREGHPVSFNAPESKWIFLGPGFPDPGVHQIIDDQTPRSVIEMAFGGRGLILAKDEGLDRLLKSGESLDICMKDTGNIEFSRKWMPASQRIALGIPLHPASMTGDDWLVLPGIGEKLAERIEIDRQKNGEFLSLEDLQRVSGIGKKRINAWKDLFYEY